MDVRPGRGWPNPPAVKMLGFIREAGQVLFELFPGRLHRCVVFPVPTVAASVWGAAKKVLDPTVASRVVVVSGPAEMDSPVPVAKLLPYVSRENLQILEEARRAAFARRRDGVSSYGCMYSDCHSIQGTIPMDMKPTRS